MPFFLPSALIDFEYFGGTLPTKKEQEIAKPYQKEIDFAFFAVNFGYSKRDYDELTCREKLFIYKAWENKLVSESYNIYNSVFKAVYNAMRDKKRRALKLLEKHTLKKADMEIVNKNMEVVKEAEKNDGDSWVRKIYQANKIPFKKGG